MKKSIIALAILFVLTGCSHIDSGTITQKVNEPERHYFITTYCGKGCFMVIPQFDDEDWRFDLDNGEDTGYVYVTEQTFDLYEVGDQYTTPKDK